MIIIHIIRGEKYNDFMQDFLLGFPRHTEEYQNSNMRTR